MKMLKRLHLFCSSHGQSSTEMVPSTKRRAHVDDADANYVIVHLNGERVALAVEAVAGDNGYVIVPVRDGEDFFVTEDHELVYEKKRGRVELFEVAHASA